MGNGRLKGEVSRRSILLLQFTVTESAEGHLTVVGLALLLGCGRSTGTVVRRAVDMLEQGHGSSSLLWLLP